MKKHTLILIAALASLTACDTMSGSSDSVQLKGGIGELRFATDGAGQSVMLCRSGSCHKAPDSEYKTARGLTIPVINGHVKYAERPNLNCRYEYKNDKEHVTCAERR